MAILRSKTVETAASGGPYYVGCSLTDDLTVSDDEAYKLLPLMTGAYKWEYNDGLQYYEMASGLGNSIIHLNRNGRAALVYDGRSENQNMTIATSRETASVDFYFDEYSSYTEQTTPVGPVSEYPKGYLYAQRGSATFSTNIPIFDTIEEANLYLNAASEETAHLYLANAINYVKSEYNPETTKVWTYSSRHANVELVRGSVTELSNIGYRTLKFQSNTEPVFYIDGDTFEVKLLAPNVLASVYVAGPEQVADNVPESSWTEGALAYSGPFYTSLSRYIQKMDTTPPDGDYVYPIEYQTNIRLAANREQAEEAITTGDYSKLGPGSTKEYNVPIGSEEEETEFGGGGFMSPFFTILSGSKSDIHRLAEVLFTDDGNLWDDIKRGLELYGSNPIDYVIDIKAFGFNLANVTTQSTRSDVWFGSYRHHFETPFNEIINLSANYIDAGSFFMSPVQYSYLDFAPFTTVSIYIPYHGWEEIDFKKYYNKQVNCRYYVDVLTGQALFVTLCDGILCDQFGPFEIGTELPLTGTNFSQWAQGQVRLLTQAAQSLVGGIAGGATSGSVAGFASGSLQSLIPATQALQTAKQQGGVRNTMITKGNFTAQIGNYMPGYVFFRFDIHEMLEPTLLQSLVGRPAYASGNVRDFSGFIQGDVVKLDTSGMSDEEASQIISLLQNGIYI